MQVIEICIGTYRSLKLWVFEIMIPPTKTSNRTNLICVDAMVKLILSSGRLGRSDDVADGRPTMVVM